MALFATATNFINKQLGIGSIKTSSGGVAYPWGKESADAFFDQTIIEPDRWNRLYPYRLVVIDVNNNNKIVSSSFKDKFGLLPPKSISTLLPNGKGGGGISYIVTQEPVNTNWVYNFPITPQQYSVTDQFAISTNATMRGVVEEHNGIKFKMISMSGSTGIWAQKPVSGGTLKHPSILGGLAGNTLENLGNVIGQANKVARAFSGDKSPGIATNPADSDSLTQTGYFHAQILGQFLERYAMAKKNPSNKGWRLVLDIPKDNQSYIVTPVQFSLNKSAQKPNEHIWSIQLKAWKRIDLNLKAVAALNEPLNLGSPNILSRINDTLRETRRTVGASVNLIKAVRSDFQKPLNSLRQAALAVKDLGGFVYTVADMPQAIIDDYKYSIQDSLYIAQDSFKRPSQIRASSSGQTLTGVTASAMRASTLEAKAGNSINLLAASVGINEGLSGSAIAEGALGNDAAQQQELNPINEVFKSPEENFDLFDGVDISSLVLTPEQQAAIDDEIQNATLITQDDLRSYREDILSLALSISNNFGAGNTTYSNIYGIPAPKERATPMTIDETEILSALFEAIQAFDILTSTKLFDDSKKENSLEYVGNMANQAGIPFENSTSKFLVPVPFGLTIEEISARYLENTDRWIEIATLNNLRSPYIDEDGFTYSLLSNATGRQFNVNDSLKQLYIGQKIMLSANTIPQFVRRITNIEKISDTNYLITVDGLADLDNLQTSLNAKIIGYLPGTVNSQDQIFIPSSLPSDADDRIALPPAFDNDRLTKISRIDWLLTDDGDIAINGVGDFRIANGLNNLVQALKIKIRTKRGSLMRHPEFGIGINPGISLADVESGAIAQELTELITSDSRFSGIERLTIAINGPTMSIDMAVILANNSGIIPISFDV
jgi:hypothetical protein